MEEILLVDTMDRAIGYAEKIEVHRNGWLHRAFSIVIFNRNREMLLQQRARHKYHSGGLWANACCSHPVKGSEIEDRIHGRLQYEMGFDCPLSHVDFFIYREELDGSDLIEYEYDHIYRGTYDGEVHPNPDEVQNYRWAGMEELKHEIRETPENFARWFKYLLPYV